MTLLNTRTHHLHHRALACTLLDRLASAAPTEAGKPGTLICLDFDDGPGESTLLLLDLLASLGAVKLDFARLTARVPSVQAGYLLRLLSDLIDCGEPLVTDWTHERLTPPAELRHPFAHSVDLLAALERRRLELLPGAAPVREQTAAVGVILRDSLADSCSFLLAYDHNAEAWQLPGGRFEMRDGSLHATLLRELSEELECGPLSEPADLSLTPLKPPFAITRQSPTYGLLTRTTFHAYLVHFTHHLPALHSGLRWVSEDEVLTKQTSDHQRVSAEPLIYLLRDTKTLLSLLTRHECT